MLKHTNNIFLIVILAIISLTIISALIIQYWLGHEPCKLCLYERIPYFLSMLLIIKILFIKKYEKITFLILSLVFIGSAALAFYHFGIEQGFFSESLACTTGDLSKTLSKEELDEKLSYLIEKGFVSKNEKNDDISYLLDTEKLSKVLENDDNFKNIDDGLAKLDSFLN